MRLLSFLNKRNVTPPPASQDRQRGQSCAPWSVLVVILRTEEAGKKVCYLKLKSWRGKQLGLHSSPTGLSWAQRISATLGKGPLQSRCHLHSSERLEMPSLFHIQDITCSIHSHPFLPFLLPRMAQQNGPDRQVCHLPVSQQAAVLSRPFLLPQLTV